MAITGKPLAATAGAMIFEKGGNAVDAACAMLAAVCTMYDTCQLGRRDAGAHLQPADEEGHRHQRARCRADRRDAGVLPAKGMEYPPEYGPLAAVTPGTPGRPDGDAGRVRHALAEGGARAGHPDGRRLSDRGAGRRRDRARRRSEIKQWPYSSRSSCRTRARSAKRRDAGEIFQPAGPRGHAAQAGRSRGAGARCRQDRKQAIYAAYDRFYKGDIARGIRRAARGSRAVCTRSRTWRTGRCKSRSRSSTDYKGIEVYKLTHWTQGPVMLQALNILEPLDLQGDGLQQRALHPHALPGDEPRLRRSRLLLRRSRTSRRKSRSGPALEGLRDASARSSSTGSRTIPIFGPAILSVPGRHESVSRISSTDWSTVADRSRRGGGRRRARFDEAFRAGTTSIQAADEEGWAISVTPSGGWIPACIAGTHRHRHEPAHAELRARRSRESVQRRRAGQTPARRR